MAQIIACCAQKGGCAKTVTVHNLSVAFKRMGKSVLAVDFDTQASLTTCFGINPDHVPVNIADLMNARIVDVTPTSLTLQSADTAERTATLIDLLHPYGIKEICRTGTIALEKGADPTRKN